MRKLAAFDFDYTILDDNSDTAILALLNKDQIPLEIKNLQFSEGWTAFMQGIFTFAKDQGVHHSQINALVKNLPSVNGMIELINSFHANHYDLIIISDSNSVFIRAWLEEHHLDHVFMEIFTNPAEIVNGMLKITPYHEQENCKLSTRNLCKGQILEEFIADREQIGVKYERIVYIGDGVNDFCPVLRLKNGDLACARKDFKLVDLIEKARDGKCLDNSGKAHEIQAEVLVWENGHQIRAHLQL